MTVTPGKFDDLNQFSRGGGGERWLMELIRFVDGSDVGEEERESVRGQGGPQGKRNRKNGICIGGAWEVWWGHQECQSRLWIEPTLRHPQESRKRVFLEKQRELSIIFVANSDEPAAWVGWGSSLWVQRQRENNWCPRGGRTQVETGSGILETEGHRNSLTWLCFPSDMGNKAHSGKQRGSLEKTAGNSGLRAWERKPARVGLICQAALKA